MDAVSVLSQNAFRMLGNRCFLIEASIKHLFVYDPEAERICIRKEWQVHHEAIRPRFNCSTAHQQWKASLRVKWLGCCNIQYGKSARQPVA